MTKRKAIILGLDGATFDLLIPFAQRGIMPNIRKLFEKGGWANLWSTIPPYTGPAWVSFATGVNPGKHGIVEFVEYSSNYEVNKYIQSYSSRVQTFWEILSHEDIRVGIVHVPLTYPPYEINGFMISGMYTPSPDTNFTYPIELKNELKNNIRDYCPPYAHSLVYRNDDKEFIEGNFRFLKIINEELLYLINNKNWELLVVVLHFPDILQHHYWVLLDPYLENIINNKNIEKSAILDIYKGIDRLIGSFIKLLRKRDFLIIVSDHGFSRFKYAFNLRAFLVKQGFLISKNIKEKNILGHWISGFLRKVGLMYSKDNIKSTNWDKTIAYTRTPVSHGIWINLKGRETQGVVSQSQYMDYINDIWSKLKRLKGPGLPFKEIYIKSEIYHGPNSYQLPDIVVDIDDRPFSISTNPSYRMIASINDWEGKHHSKGVFIIYSPSLEPRGKLPDLKIYDVAPTIIWLFGKPIPEWMDGKVIFDKNPRKYSLNMFTDRKYVSQMEHTTETIEKRLRSLGYL